MALRDSSGWCDMDWWNTVSSSTRSASARPASTSPTCHSSAAAPPAGNSPRSAAAQSASSHLTVVTSVPLIVLPSRRAFGPPGRKLSSGSSTNGSGSRSSRMRSTASAAVVSSTAATARIGSPSYFGSLVSAASLGVSTGGRSAAVRMAATPGRASAALVSMRRTRPCGIGLTSSFANSMPSARKSSAYLARPVTFATRSAVEYGLPISL